MFDIVLASAPATSFSERMASALRAARMRVVPCEVAPLRPPPALRVDAAVACAPSVAVMIEVARSVRAALDGPPPVVGVSGGPQGPAARELVQALPEDVPGPVLAAHVQRAAAQAGRRSSKIVLRGELAEVGLTGLLASLAVKARSCFVRIQDGTRRAELTLEGGRLVHVRADGVDASQDRQAALRAVGAWAAAAFEVIAADGSLPPARSYEAEGPPTPVSFAPPAGGAGDVALAAAVLNACAAYGRVFLGPEKGTALFVEAWARARVERPFLDAFAVSPEGLVSVAQVARARTAIPGAIAAWLDGFFADAALVDPARFQRVHLREVLGGLTRLVEQVGWATALLDNRRTTGEGPSHG